MVEYLDVNLEDIFNEIRELRETQGLLTREEYFELIDEVLEEKRRVGELPDDWNLEAAKGMLRRRWADIENEET